MTDCRFPFLDCTGCDRCAVPVIVIPPEVPALQTKLAMLCAIGLLLSALAVFTLAFPNAFERVNSANQEQVR